MRSLNHSAWARHKHFLRLHYRAEVLGLPAHRRRDGARSVARRVAALVEFRRAETVGVFLSTGGEIDTAPLITLARRAGKRLAVPVVFPEGKKMRFALLPPHRSAWGRNVYGIWEPLRPEWLDFLDFLIVPGVAFTAQGDRLGAGGGYYDRFLARRPRPVTVGICFDEQKAVRLPRSVEDQRVAVVVTPTRTDRPRHD